MGTYKKMPSANKRAWVKALRSGKYKQGRYQLCTETDDGPRFCPVGVAADVLIDDWWVLDEDWWVPDGGSGVWRLGEGMVYALSTNYAEAIGLDRRAQDTIVHMSDVLGMTLTEIADWIEANL